MPVLSNITQRIVSAAIIILCSVSNLSAQKDPSREYQLKAVFLFNFTQFVDWPAGSYTSGQAPLVIGVLGENPFGTYLEEIVAGEKINEHPVIVRYYKDANEINTCSILFLNVAETNKRRQALTTLKGLNILTVSDHPDFLNEGGMIRFFTRNNKIKLQINPEASKAAKLVLSSKLLSLAEIFVQKENN